MRAGPFHLPLLATVAVSLSGCGGLDLEAARGTEGLLQIAFTQTTPAEAAAMALDPYDPNRRYRGTLLLANAYFASEPVYIALFEERVSDSDPGVRAAAVRGLANHGGPEHVPLLVASLDDKDRLVRFEAARGLQRLHNPIAVTPLLRRIRIETEPDAAIRAEAAAALGQYAQGRVLDALVELIDDRDLVVQRNALDSLETLTGQVFGLDRKAWTEWVSRATDPFAQRTAYEYPVYSRKKHLYEYLPFIPPPPNEIASTPAGYPRTGL